ncbi:MAG: hypothetical protein HGA87_02705 [Desulfobulbaceae bacterium]|nr:hypothetical protein [Desulfobulbaceae bacterium]
MEFNGFDKERKVFTVTFQREEAEDFYRLMKGIADHIEEMDKAALSLYSREEAQPYVKYTEEMLRSFETGASSKRFHIPETKLLGIMDVVTSLPDIEGEKSCMELGLSLSQVRTYGKALRAGYRTYVEPSVQFSYDKKKLNNPAL